MPISDDIAYLIFEYMRRFDTWFERMEDDVRDIKVRLTSLEEGMAGIHCRIDRIEDRVTRIERRLDLVAS